jgi:O-antigen/teichoic acid export membrane protein
VFEEPNSQFAATEPVGKMHAREIALAVRNGLKLGASLVLTWSVALIVKLQIPAHLGPILQGHFAFSESFAGMFFNLMHLGIETYIVKEVSVRREHASDFVGGVFALRLLMCVAIFVAMATTLYLTGRGPDVQLAVFVFGMVQVFGFTNGTLATLLQATTHVGRLAIANVLAKIVWGAGLLLALRYGAPIYVLALPMLASEVVRTAFLVPAASLSAKLRYRVDLKALRSVLAASLPFYVAFVAGAFGTPLAMSTLGFIRRDEREVGWFAAAQNIGSLAMLLHPLLAWVVMPMLSRVRAVSEQEMMSLVRRIIQALLIVVVPGTTLITAGSELFIHTAFGDRYMPAATGLSILSLVFLMFYLSIIMSNALVISGRSWSVTIISSSAVFLMPLFMITFVPLGRALFGTGGECAGAAMAVVANEVFVVIAMLSRFPSSPFDRRNIVVLLKAAAISATVLVNNHWMLRLGPVRLLLDAGLYACLALLTGLVRTEDVRRCIRAMRESRAASPAA